MSEVKITEEEIELLRTINGYLDHTSDSNVHDLLYRTPSMSLRYQADVLDKKDGDIEKFRHLIKNLLERKDINEQS